MNCIKIFLKQVRSQDKSSQNIESAHRCYIWLLTLRIILFSHMKKRSIFSLYNRVICIQADMQIWCYDMHGFKKKSTKPNMQKMVDRAGVFLMIFHNSLLAKILNVNRAFETQTNKKNKLEHFHLMQIKFLSATYK